MVGQAIETIYKGYKFRSRLEARYAVFFDAMNEEWEYEKEGYDLGGVWYLPDFYLPRFRCFVEVKGQTPTPAEYQKALMFRDSVGKAIIICTGLPREYWGDLYCWDISDSSGGSADFNAAWCMDGDCFVLGVESGSHRTLFADSHFEHALPALVAPKIRAGAEQHGIIKAKQARFEHGQCG